MNLYSPSPSAYSILTMVEFDPPPAPISLHSIIKACAEMSGVPPTDITGPYRTDKIVTARFVYYFLARRLTRKTLPQIAHHCGNRDHSTVIHGIAKVSANPEKYVNTIAAAKKLLGVE